MSTVYYHPVRSFRQNHSPSGITIYAGREYRYLDSRVRVLEINAAEDGSGAEVHFETGFGERGIVDANELGRWGKKHKPTLREL